MATKPVGLLYETSKPVYLAYALVFSCEQSVWQSIGIILV